MGSSLDTAALPGRGPCCQCQAGSPAAQQGPPLQVQTSPLEKARQPSTGTFEQKHGNQVVLPCNHGTLETC